MIITLINAHLLSPSLEMYPGGVQVSDSGKIIFAGSMDNLPVERDKIIDLHDLFLVPGFIDIHVHGGNGITFGSSGDAQKELRDYSRWVVGNGVTGFLTTLAAPDSKALIELVGQYADAMRLEVAGAEPLGIHLEGPYLNKEKNGAFNPDWIHPPSISETEALLDAGQGWIRQITLAPELPHADEVAARWRRGGGSGCFGAYPV
jgi:N-acetylglucosamine-6-phosphate deacetylase